MNQDAQTGGLGPTEPPGSAAGCRKAMPGQVWRQDRARHGPRQQSILSLCPV